MTNTVLIVSVRKETVCLYRSRGFDCLGVCSAASKVVSFTAVEGVVAFTAVITTTVKF